MLKQALFIISAPYNSLFMVVYNESHAMYIFSNDRIKTMKIPLGFKLFTSFERDRGVVDMFVSTGDAGGAGILP